MLFIKLSGKSTDRKAIQLTMDKRKARGNALLLLAALIWGGAFVTQSVAMDHIGPFTFNGIRNFVGCFVLFIAILIINKRKGRTASPTTDPAARKKLLLGGICCGIVLFVSSSLQQIGIQYTSVGKAGFITALYILFVPLLGLFFHRRPNPLLWISVAIALAGMYLLCINESFTIGTGDLLMLAGALCFAIHILVIGHFSPHVDCLHMSCIQLFVCGCLCMIAMLFTEQPQLPAIFDAWLPILYAGILSSGVAYTLQMVAQKNTDPTVASLLLSLESVFAVLAGWIILGEQLTLRELLGCALVFVAILLAQLPTKKKQAKLIFHQK